MWCSGVRMRRRLSRQAWPNLWKLFSDNSSLTLRQIRPAEPHRATGRPEFRRGLRSRYSQLPHLRNFANPAGSQCIHASKPEAVSNGFASDLGDPASEGYESRLPNFDYPLLLSQDGPPSGVVTFLVIVSEFVRGSSKESIFGFVIIIAASSPAVRVTRAYVVIECADRTKAHHDGETFSQPNGVPIEGTCSNVTAGGMMCVQIDNVVFCAVACAPQPSTPPANTEQNMKKRSKSGPRALLEGGPWAEPGPPQAAAAARRRGDSHCECLPIFVRALLDNLPTDPHNLKPCRLSS